jgi:competence protein ComEA
MYSLWEKLEKREKASLVGVYAASLALVWTLGYGWGRSSSASSPMQVAGVSPQSSVEVIDLSQPPKPEAVPTEPTAPTEPTPSAEVVVHVSGAVKRAGVYRLAPDSRVADAIEQAGGATEHADLDALNLAEPLQDGQKIHVPRKGEVSAPTVASVPPSRTPRGTPQAAATATTQFPINLNTATAEQLEAIPGIGPVLAQRIIEYRQTHGRFQSVDELLEVRGIGPKRLESMRPYVTVR